METSTGDTITSGPDAAALVGALKAVVAQRYPLALIERPHSFSQLDVARLDEYCSRTWRNFLMVAVDTDRVRIQLPEVVVEIRPLEQGGFQLSASSILKLNEYWTEQVNALFAQLA